MYRAAASYALERGVEPGDAPRVLELLPDMDLAVEYEDGAQRVIVNGEDVTPFIRTPRIARGASDIGVIPEVRLKLVDIQRGVSRRYDIVMDGRDIGTYVLPDADFKFYLTAGAPERARRRFLEEKEPGLTLEQIEKEIAARDKTDMAREFAPLRQAEDAVLVDTTHLDAGGVIDRLIGIIIGAD
jgi:cytidylate kinase